MAYSSLYDLNPFGYLGGNTGGEISIPSTWQPTPDPGLTAMGGLGSSSGGLANNPTTLGYTGGQTTTTVPSTFNAQLHAQLRQQFPELQYLAFGGANPNSGTSMSALFNNPQTMAWFQQQYGRAPDQRFNNPLFNLNLKDATAQSAQVMAALNQINSSLGNYFGPSGGSPTTGVTPPTGGGNTPPPGGTPPPSGNTPPPGGSTPPPTGTLNEQMSAYLEAIDNYVRSQGFYGTPTDLQRQQLGLPTQAALLQSLNAYQNQLPNAANFASGSNFGLRPYRPTDNPAAGFQYDWIDPDGTSGANPGNWGLRPTENFWDAAPGQSRADDLRYLMETVNASNTRFLNPQVYQQLLQSAGIDPNLLRFTGNAQQGYNAVLGNLPASLGGTGGTGGTGGGTLNQTNQAYYDAVQQYLRSAGGVFGEITPDLLRQRGFPTMEALLAAQSANVDPSQFFTPMTNKPSPGGTAPQGFGYDWYDPDNTGPNPGAWTLRPRENIFDLLPGGTREDLQSIIGTFNDPNYGYMPPTVNDLRGVLGTRGNLLTQGQNGQRFGLAADNIFNSLAPIFENRDLTGYLDELIGGVSNRLNPQYRNVRSNNIANLGNDFNSFLNQFNSALGAEKLPSLQDLIGGQTMTLQNSMFAGTPFGAYTPQVAAPGGFQYQWTDPDGPGTGTPGRYLLTPSAAPRTKWDAEQMMQILNAGGTDKYNYSIPQQMLSQLGNIFNITQGPTPQFSLKNGYTFPGGLGGPPGGGGVTQQTAPINNTGNTVNQFGLPSTNQEVAAMNYGWWTNPQTGQVQKVELGSNGQPLNMQLYSTGGMSTGGGQYTPLYGPSSTTGGGGTGSGAGTPAGGGTTPPALTPTIPNPFERVDGTDYTGASYTPPKPIKMHNPYNLWG